MISALRLPREYDEVAMAEKLNSDQKNNEKKIKRLLNFYHAHNEITKQGFPENSKIGVQHFFI